jgi:hypothetical protein
MSLVQIISADTGFDQGDRFESDQQVLDYFTSENQRMMFGADALASQEILDEYAAAVIENRWHYA